MVGWYPGLVKPGSLERREGDSDDFLTIVDTAVGLHLRLEQPREVYVVRIDNWFGQKWLGFKGKVMGTLGVSNRNALVVPPFVPNRVERIDYWQREEGQYHSAAPLKELHLMQESGENLSRKLSDLSVNGSFFWYSAASEKNGRGSIMHYRVVDRECKAWYVECRNGPNGWAFSKCVGVAPEEVDLWISS